MANYNSNNPNGLIFHAVDVYNAREAEFSDATARHSWFSSVNRNHNVWNDRVERVTVLEGEGSACPPDDRDPTGGEDCPSGFVRHTPEGPCVPAGAGNSGVAADPIQGSLPPIEFLAPKREITSEELKSLDNQHAESKDYASFRRKMVINEHLYYDLEPKDIPIVGVSADNATNLIDPNPALYPFRSPYRAIITNRLGVAGLNRPEIYNSQIDFLRYCLGAFWTSIPRPDDDPNIAQYRGGVLIPKFYNQRFNKDEDMGYKPVFVEPVDVDWSPGDAIGQANIELIQAEDGQLPVRRSRYALYGNPFIYDVAQGEQNLFYEFLQDQTPQNAALVPPTGLGFTWFSPGPFLYQSNPAPLEISNWTQLRFNEWSVFSDNFLAIGEGSRSFAYSYVDTVHQCKMPYFKVESSHLDHHSNLNVEFGVHTTYVSNFFKNQQGRAFHHEYLMPNLYRIYKTKEDPIPALFDPASDFDYCNRDDRVLKFTSKNVELFADAKTKMINRFPMAVTIDLQTSQGSRFTQLMRRTGLDKYLLDYLSKISFPSRDNSRDFFTEIIDQDVSAAYLNLAGDREFLGRRLIASLSKSSETSRSGAEDRSGTINDAAAYCQPRIHFDLFAWLKDIDSAQKFVPVNEDEFPLGVFSRGNLLNDRSGAATVFEFFLNRGVMLSMLDRESKRWTRSYDQILQGQLAHSETVAYKISKHIISIDDSTGEEVVDWSPLQEFYFTDSDQIQEINFVDTQVKYGRKYKYRIWAYNIVYGNYYHYMFQPFQHETESSFKGPHAAANSPLNVPSVFNCGLGSLDVFNKPYICMLEVPYLERTVYVKDAPPIFPNTELVPLKGYDNIIKINLSANTGEYYLFPETIFEDENIFTSDVYASQTLRNDGKVLFKSDDMPMFYEWFRTCRPPRSYRDFSDLSEPSTTWGSIPSDAGLSSGATVFHNIDPNKKYYYTFRSVDSAGKSIPSAVFEVALMSYVDGIFFHFKEYSFLREKPLLSIKFKQNLQIKPSIFQRAPSFLSQHLRPNSGGLLDSLLSIPMEQLDRGQGTAGHLIQHRPSVSLGDPSITTEYSVWDREFKFRIRSLKSGKSIDLNAKFFQEVVSSFDITGTPVDQAEPPDCDPDKDTTQSPRPNLEIELERGPCPEGFVYDGVLCVPEPQDPPPPVDCGPCEVASSDGSGCQPVKTCPTGFELVSVPVPLRYPGVDKDCACVPVCGPGRVRVNMLEWFTILREEGGDLQAARSRACKPIDVTSPDKDIEFKGEPPTEYWLEEDEKHLGEYKEWFKGSGHIFGAVGEGEGVWINPDGEGVGVWFGASAGSDTRINWGAHLWTPRDGTTFSQQAGTWTFDGESNQWVFTEKVTEVVELEEAEYILV